MDPPPSSAVARPSRAATGSEGERILGSSGERVDLPTSPAPLGSAVAGPEEDTMTDDKDFKRLVRARMAETGLSYTQARATLSPGRPGGGGGGLPRDARIFVTGHRGLVGSALVRRLEALGHSRILTATRDQLDLRDQAAVNYWFRANRPDYVFLVAGKVGGIMANATRPAEFLYDNMLIHGTVVHASHEHGVRRLLYLGSSCVYPREARQPITEDRLLTGPLEPTNEAYAIAKIAGIKLCQSYRSQYGDDFVAAMPTNLYGPNDNFDDVGGHVVPMLMRRFHEARLAGASTVTVWGTGTPRRELLHVDDLASACLLLMAHDDPPDLVNVGTGCDHTVREIAEAVRDVVHPEATLALDPTKPDGMPRKVLDVTRIQALGWHPTIDLPTGLRSTYGWYRAADRIRGHQGATTAA
jgi:GDP-L-fucose synthase